MIGLISSNCSTETYQQDAFVFLFNISQTRCAAIEGLGATIIILWLALHGELKGENLYRPGLGQDFDSEITGLI